MYLTPVTPKLNNPIHNESAKVQKKEVSFQAHPDFENLAKMCHITASSYFRRGPYYGSSDKEFGDIVMLFNRIFGNLIGRPKKMLIAGIGDSQEPFSYLAVIKKAIKDKKLSDVLELDTVDIQSKPSTEKLFTDSYYEFSDYPDFVPSSFVKDVRTRIKFDLPWVGHYRVNDEIFKFLKYTYNKKSLWETQIQMAARLLPKDSYDIISINNTLGYILDEGTRVSTVQNLSRILKGEGIFITDPNRCYLEEADVVGGFEKIADGIFTKKVVHPPLLY